jgi:hypothetical protein
MTAPVSIFTIVSRNYISYAATLMQSVAIHHPDAARYVFLADVAGEFPGLDLPATVVTAAEIGIRQLRKMAFDYHIIELNTAIKPFCVRWLMNEMKHTNVIYLDPDILVLRPLTHVTGLIDSGAELVLTPHMTAPLQDGYHPDDLAIMKSGVYNLGFCAFSRSHASDRFIDWWSDRLTQHCRVDIPNHLFTDQRWMDLAPAFIEKTALLHHPGYNLAYWNLLHRPVTQDCDGTWRAAGELLHFVHFSGVNPLKPAEFSKHQNRFTIDTIGGLRPLFEHYVAALLANGYRDFIETPYGYGTFPNGRRINAQMRNYGRRIEDAGETLPPGYHRVLRRVLRRTGTGNGPARPPQYHAHHVSALARSCRFAACLLVGDGPGPPGIHQLVRGQGGRRGRNRRAIA